MNTIFIKTAADLERCFPIVKELRPNLKFEDFLSIYQDAHDSDGFELVAIENDGKIKPQ